MNGELAESTDLAARAKRANQAHRLACKMAKGALEHARASGEELNQIKVILGHGKFLPWLKENFEGSDRSARGYMRIAANWQSVANLDATSLTGALASLKAPPPSVPPSPALPTIECESTQVEATPAKEGASVVVDPPLKPTVLEDHKPQTDPLKISAKVRDLLNGIESIEGLGRVAIADVIRYCYRRLKLDPPSNF